MKNQQEMFFWNELVPSSKMCVAFYQRIPNHKILKVNSFPSTIVIVMTVGELRKKNLEVMPKIWCAKLYLHVL